MRRQCTVPRPWLVRVSAVIAGVAALAWGPVAGADDDPVAFFDPLLAIAPGIAREANLLFDHGRADGDRLTLTALRLQYPVLSWLQFSLEVPGVIREPEADAWTAGVGDSLLSGQARAWAPRGGPAQVDLGLELTLPTGDSARGLGGSTALRPFVAAGTKLGGFDVLGNLSYQWGLDGPLAGVETFQAIVAVGYAIRWLVPFTELTLVKPVRGDDDLRPQLAAAPGLEIFLPGNLSLSIGVQLPLGAARAFDQRVLGLLKMSF
jgi:Putative MetA-pathway of phenol degradation